MLDGYLVIYYDHLHFRTVKMISHEALYNLANVLGLMAVTTVLAYHFVAVNGKYLAGGASGRAN